VWELCAELPDLVGSGRDARDVEASEVREFTGEGERVDGEV
jgi:hypothetical protein